MMPMFEFVCEETCRNRDTTFDGKLKLDALAVAISVPSSASQEHPYITRCWTLLGTDSKALPWEGIKTLLQTRQYF